MSVDHIVYLTADDDIASLHERLRRAQADLLILVIPDNVAVLRQVVGVRLVQRYSAQMGITIIIVTRDRATEDMCRRYGFAVYHDIDKIPPRKRGGIDANLLAAAPRLPPVPIYRRLVGAGFWLVAIVLVMVGAVTISLAAGLVMPSAVIRLVPATEMLTTTINITGGPQIRVLDADKGQLPARSVQVLIEDTGQVETTGQKRVPDAAATGTVVFASRSLGAITIPKGTVVRTSTGQSVRFRTEEEASLPAGAFATVRVPIKAIDPGPNGNVKAGTINVVEGTLAFQVSVLNDEDTKDGSEKQVSFVTLQDRATLRDVILKKIQANSYSELLKAIQPGDILPAETLTIAVNESSFDKPLDAEGTYLTGKVRATVSGLVLDGDDLKTLVLARLRDRVPPGFIILPDSITIGTPGSVRYSDGVLTLQITATARSQAAIDRQDVQRLAAGKTVEMAGQEIARRFSLARPPEIAVERPFFGRLPLLTARIAVISE